MDTTPDKQIPEVAQATEAQRRKPGVLIGGVRPRVLALILLTQAIMVWWVADSEIARGIHVICYSLMMPTVLYLLLVRVFRRWLPFEDKELLLGYIVTTATIPVIGYGGMRFPTVGAGFLRFFSETQPQWGKYLPHLSGLPVLQSEEAIQGLYRGADSVPWHAWTGVIAFWSIYLLLLAGIWLCLAGVLRRVWIHQERLTFPIAVLPIRLMDPRDDIFTRPLFWMGFGIPLVLQSLLVLHDWYPTVPAFQLKAFEVRQILFTEPPWNAIPSLMVGFYPMAVGLAFFVPSDVSFSCWFLAIAMKLVYVLSAVFGVEAAGTGASRFPYREEQAAGAWIAFAALIVWGARHHWRTVAKLVPDEERAAVGRMAVGAAVCTAGCAAMMTMIGIPLLASACVILVYGAYVLSGARVRAEAGAQWTFAPLSWTAHRVANSTFGTGAMDTRALVAGTHMDLLHVDIRAQSLPYLMEGLDIAERSGIKWRTVLIWVAVGTVTAIAVGWWSSLSKLYELGAATAKAEQYPLRKAGVAFNELQRLSTAAKDWDMQGVGAMLMAGAITVVLSWSRRLGAFGLHPVGYVLSNTLTMNAFIVPFFMAWVAKTAVLRFGGNRAYRQAVPFFVGVVLGDIVTQAGWAVVGGVFDVPIYQFLS